MDGLPFREANDLTLGDMEAMYFAKTVNHCLRSGDWSSALDFMLSQFPQDDVVGTGLRLIKYERGLELLNRYHCYVGARLVNPFYVDGTPRYDHIAQAYAWFAAPCGRIANVPAYHVVRFHPCIGDR